MKRILLLLILSVCLLPLWSQETVTPVKPLSARIDALIEHKLPAGSNVAISVYDLTAGKPLYGYQADKLSRPASTMKLLTTITALSRPEADEPFRTEVWYQGTIERDTLQGDMYVIGGYDPEFDEEALDSLVAAVALVSILRGSGVNTAGPDGAALPSMPMAMALFASDVAGAAWPMLAAFVGGLGAFITGSCTVSDMLFANFQWDMGGLLDYPALGKYIIVAAQGVGGAAGNMICIHNIVAVCAVLGMIGKEGIILRRTIWPFLLYCVVAGTVCFYLIGRVL